MTRIIILLVLSGYLAVPAYAGEVTIRETDSQIIVEYSPGEDDVKAAKAQEAEREVKRQSEEAEAKKQEAEEQRHQERMDKAKRRAAAKGIAIAPE